MNNDQPEALRLADGLEKVYGLKAAAIEMRRLHGLNVELVEALSELLPGAEAMGWSTDKAHKAIAKATGESND